MIQLIQYVSSYFLNNPLVECSKLNAPKAMDDFEVNIIDISSNDIWYNSSNTTDVININKDFESISKMVDSSRKSNIVFVLPRNVTFRFLWDTNKRTYQRSSSLKDILSSINNIINTLIPNNPGFKLLHEITTTTIQSYDYGADFSFIFSDDGIITKSNKSEKATTIKIYERVFITTLNITCDTMHLDNFVNSIIFPREKETAPQWVKDYEFNGDKDYIEKINYSQNIIKAEMEKIESSKKIIAENLKYKSILYTNGDELVSIVHEILEKVLNISLSEFDDKKNEDFLIKLDEITFIGEIKGVTSNVRSDNISQIDNHYHTHMDNLEEKGLTESVKQILIINPLRSKPLSEREPIHDKQVKLANRNNCLIIETKILLKLFEKFLNKQISTSDCIRIFTEKTGLLKIDDIST